jgi:hypothetical protein
MPTSTSLTSWEEHEIIYWQSRRFFLHGNTDALQSKVSGQVTDLGVEDD